MFDYFLQQFVSSELNTLLSQPDQFADFTQLGYLTTQYNNVTAIAVFLAWIKLFKYLSFNKTMKQLVTSMSNETTVEADSFSFCAWINIIYDIC